jgi:hypothetical protein
MKRRRCKFRGEGCLGEFEPTHPQQKYCVPCRIPAERAKHKKYRRAHRDKLNAQRRRQRLKNLKKARADSKITEAKPAIKATRRRYVEAHREEINAAARKRWPKRKRTANAKRKKRYRKNRKNILAKLKKNRARQRALAADALLLKDKLAQLEAQLAASAPPKRRKGRDRKDETADRVIQYKDRDKLSWTQLTTKMNQHARQSGLEEQTKEAYRSLYRSRKKTLGRGDG